MTELTPHDLNVLIAIGGLLMAGFLLAFGAWLYDRYARTHQHPHPRSH